MDSTEPRPESALPRPLILVLGLLVLLAYVLPRLSFFYPDSVLFAGDISHGSWSERIHPHHLAYSSTVWLLWRLATGMGIETSPLEVMRLLSRAAALASIVVAVDLFRLSGFRPWWTVLATLLFGSAWSLWLYSTTPTSYPLALVFLLLIYRELLDWSREGITEKSLARVATCFTLAILWHQLAALTIIPILGWAAITAKRQHERVLWAPMVRQLILPIVGLYLIGGIIASRSLDPRALLHWATSYGHQGQYWWWTRIPAGESPFGYWWELLSQSHAHLFWSPRYSALSELQQNLTQSGRTAPFAVWWQSFWNGFGYNGLIATLLTLLLGWVGVAGVVFWKRAGEERDRLLLAFLWSGPYLLFCALYQPEDSWFRLYYLFPLVWLMLADIATSSNSLTQRIGGGICALLLAFTILTNYAYGYVIWTFPNSNTRLRDVALLDQLPSGSLVFSDPGYWLWSYLYARAFAHRAVYQGEIVEGTGIRCDNYSGPLFLNPKIAAELESAPRGSFLHLGWRQADRTEPQELWIPVERLESRGPVTAGWYRFEEYEFRPLPPDPDHPLPPPTRFARGGG